MNLFSPPKYVQGELIGQDQNAYTLLGYFEKQARRSNWTESEIHQVINAAKSDDYDHLISVISSHFEDSTR